MASGQCSLVLERSIKSRDVGTSIGGFNSVLGFDETTCMWVTLYRSLQSLARWHEQVSGDLGKLPGHEQKTYCVTCSFACLTRVERGSEPLDRALHGVGSA